MFEKIYNSDTCEIVGTLELPIKLKFFIKNQENIVSLQKESLE